MISGVVAFTDPVRSLETIVERVDSLTPEILRSYALVLLWAGESPPEGDEVAFHHGRAIPIAQPNHHDGGPEAATFAGKTLPGQIYLIDRKPHAHSCCWQIESANRPLSSASFATEIGRIYGARAVAISEPDPDADTEQALVEIEQMGGQVLCCTSSANAESNIADLGVHGFTTVDRELAAELIMREHLPPLLRRALDNLARFERPLDRVIDAMSKHCGTDFSQYKRATLLRRLAAQVERDPTFLGPESIDDVISRMIKNAESTQRLTQHFLVSVTSFFRDPKAFEELQRLVIEPLVTRALAEDQELRIWVPASATGEEAFTLVMLILEAAGGVPIRKLSVFATDLDRRALAIAQQAHYSAKAVRDVPKPLIDKYFLANDDGSYTVSDKVRSPVVFACHDLTIDPPFSRIDLVSCRNLLIYLRAASQARLLSLFRFSVHRGGSLFVGASESVQAEDWQTLSAKHGIYRPIGIAPAPPEFDSNRFVDTLRGSGTLPPAKQAPKRPLPTPTREGPLESLYGHLLGMLGVDCVVVDGDGHVVYTHGELSQLLRMSRGRFSTRFKDLISPSMYPAVDEALAAAWQRQEPVVCHGVPVDQGGARHEVGLEVQPVMSTEHGRRLSVLVFHQPQAEVSGSPKQSPTPQLQRREPAEKHEFVYQPDLERKVGELDRQVEAANSALKVAAQERELAREELQTANEELVSSNEELQSTNEELQSLNEEMHTVNGELSDKVDDVNAINADLRTMMESLEVGVLLLDPGLNIRRFNPAARRYIHVVESDLGRPLRHLTSVLEPDCVAEEAAAVLEQLQPRSRCARLAHGEEVRVNTLPSDGLRLEDANSGGIVVTIGPGDHRSQPLLSAPGLRLSNPEDAIVIDDAARIIDCGQLLLEAFHAQRSDCIERPLAEFLVPLQKRSRQGNLSSPPSDSESYTRLRSWHDALMIPAQERGIVSGLATSSQGDTGTLSHRRWTYTASRHRTNLHSTAYIIYLRPERSRSHGNPPAAPPPTPGEGTSET